MCWRNRSFRNTWSSSSCANRIIIDRFSGFLLYNYEVCTSRIFQHQSFDFPHFLKDTHFLFLNKSLVFDSLQHQLVFDMRVQPTVIFSISLAHTVSSAVIEKRCKDPSWDLTIENYRKAKVDDWLAWWFPEHKDSAESIPDLIAKEFFNDVGRHCPTSPGDTSGACTSVISCNC